MVIANFLLPISSGPNASRDATPRDIFWLFSGLLVFIAIMIWTLPLNPSPFHYFFHPAVVIPFASAMWYLTYRRWMRARLSPLSA
jgi:bacteriorhodopsin